VVSVRSRRRLAHNYILHCRFVAIRFPNFDHVKPMGAKTVKGLKMMEAMFPSDDGSTVFSDRNPKLKAKLEKEIAKGKIKPDPIEDEQAVDGDNDTHIDKYVKEVWSYYDRKNQGQIEKRVALQFFKDSLELYALRKGMKVKDVLAQGVNMSKALEESYTKMSKTQGKTVSFQEFEDFVCTYDIDEALGAFLNKPSIDIDLSRVQFVDVSQFTAANKREGPKPVYRDYPDD
jgi:hypothetical protein